MSEFCYGSLCNARILAFFGNPSDPRVAQPCRHCRNALEDLLGVHRPRRERAPWLRGLFWDLTHAGMLP